MQVELPLPDGIAPAILAGSIWRRRSWSARRRVNETRVWVVIEHAGARVIGRWYDTGRKSTLSLRRFRRLCRFVVQQDTVGGGQVDAAA